MTEERYTAPTGILVLLGLSGLITLGFTLEGWTGLALGVSGTLIGALAMREWRTLAQFKATETSKEPEAAEPEPQSVSGEGSMSRFFGKMPLTCLYPITIDLLAYEERGCTGTCPVCLHTPADHASITKRFMAMGAYLLCGPADEASPARRSSGYGSVPWLEPDVGPDPRPRPGQRAVRRAVWTALLVGMVVGMVL